MLPRDDIYNVKFRIGDKHFEYKITECSNVNDIAKEIHWLLERIVVIESIERVA